MALSDIHLQQLVLAAREASKNAYAPYSGFVVGAAVLAGAGITYFPAVILKMPLMDLRYALNVVQFLGQYQKDCRTFGR